MKFIDNKNDMPKKFEIHRMTKPELKGYLEHRGFAVYDDTKKEMLETALEDWNEEHKTEEK